MVSGRLSSLQLALLISGGVLLAVAFLIFTHSGNKERLLENQEQEASQDIQLPSKGPVTNDNNKNAVNSPATGLSAFTNEEQEQNRSHYQAMMKDQDRVSQELVEKFKKRPMRTYKFKN